jgi:hypothetical protein
MTSDNQEIKNVRFVNEEIVQMDWVHKEDFIDTSGITKVVIAAYTTMCNYAQVLYMFYQRNWMYTVVLTDGTANDLVTKSTVSTNN